MELSKVTASLLLVATISSIGTTQLSAADSSNYSVAVELARTAKAEALADNIKSMNDYIKMYMFQTGDITPTISEINTFFGIDNNSWKNYNGEMLTLTNDSSKVIIGNVFTTPPSDIIKNVFVSSASLPPFTSYTADLKTLNIPYTADVDAFYKLTQKLIADPKIKIATTMPTDITKTWYQPTGNGAYDIQRYNTTQNKWTSLGTTASGSGGTGGSSIVVKSEADLQNLPATTGLTAMVSDGTIAETYVYDGSQWVKTATAGTGGLFNGTGSIVAMATTLINKAGGSIVTSSAPNNEWAGSKEFTKKDDINTNGYWISADNQFAVAKDISTLHTLRSLFTTGTTAWIDNGNGDVYKLKKQTLSNGSVAWVYQAGNYADVLNFDKVPNSGMDGLYIYSTAHNEFFYYQNNQFKSVNGKVYMTKDTNARNIFTPTLGATYLTTKNDCTASTCNGNSTTNYYAGTKIDNLYAFYPATTGKLLNNLIDARPTNNWASFWTNRLPAVLWTGGNFGDIKTNDILIKTTLNGSIAYKKGTNIFNKANARFIPQNKLPSGLTASTATITKSGTTNYVKVGKLDTFVTDTNLAVGYTVNLTGSGFVNKKIKRCNDYGSNSLWSDNCSNVRYASIAVTNGSRSDLIAPATASRINLTKNVGSEPRYKTNGIIYSKDNTYKQWFYSTSGTRTNNMLDAPPCSSSNSCYAFTTPVVFHNTHGLLTKRTNGFFQDKNGLYLNNSKWKNNFYSMNNHVHEPVPSYIVGKARNGLYYTSEPGFYVIDKAKLICQPKGMRLPTLSETMAKTTMGVPASDMTWTSTKHRPHDAIAWRQRYYVSAINYYFTFWKVRCVK